MDRRRLKELLNVARGVWRTSRRRLGELLEVARGAPRASSPAFCIYRNQPVVRLLIKFGGGSWLRVFAIALGCFVGPKLIVAGLSGTLISPVDPFTDVARLLGLETALGPAEIPLLRDYADLVIGILLAAHTAHIVQQWRRINDLPHRLRRDRLISPATLSDARFREILRTFDRRFNNWSLEAVAVAVAIPLGFVVIGAAQTHGVYGWLPTVGEQSAASQHLLGWWANRDFYPWANGVQIFVYSAYFYLLIRHTLMGTVAVQLIAAVRQSSTEDEPWLSFPDVWSEDLVGIAELRRAVNDVAISITLMVFTLLIGNLYIEFPRLLNTFFVLPYLLLNPLFLIVPALELNRQLAESRRRLVGHQRELWRRSVEMASLSQRVSAVPSERLVAIDSNRILFERAESLPRTVVDGATVGRNLVAYAIPVVLLVNSILGGT